MFFKTNKKLREENDKLREISKLHAESVKSLSIELIQAKVELVLSNKVLKDLETSRLSRSEK